MIPAHALTAECFFCRDEFYSDIDDMIEALADDGAEREDYPFSFQVCKRVYGHVSDLKSVVEGLIEDFLWEQDEHKSWWHNFTNAEEIGGHFLESTYEWCDEMPQHAPIVGTEELQWAIDVFTTLNTPIWRVFGQYRWFNPVRWAIAPNILQGGLERFEALNHPNHYVFEPSRPELLLEWNDVKDIYAELFDEAA